MRRRLRVHAAAALRRPPRRGRRGQAAVIVVLMLVALLAVVGLAIDGGMEAGNFRAAQNAADAAATAGARWAYEYANTHNGVWPTQDQLQTQVDTYLAKNHGTPGVAVLNVPHRRSAERSGGGLDYTLASASQPATTSANATSRFADLSTGTDLSVSAATAVVQSATALAQAGTDSNGATAAAQDEMAQTSTTTVVLGSPTTTTQDVLCVQATATTQSSTSQTACPGNVTSTSYGSLGSQTTVATVNSAGTAGSHATQSEVSPTTGTQTLATGGTISASATLSTQDDQVLGGDAPMVVSTVGVNNLSVALPGTTSVTASDIRYQLLVRGAYNTSTTSSTSGTTTTTTTTSSESLTASVGCNTPTVSVTVAGTAYSIPVSSSCQPTSSLPAAMTSALTALGITLSFNVLTPSSGQCTAGSSTCTVSACFIKATVKNVTTGATVASLCAVEASASITVAGGGTSTTTTSGPSDFSVTANPSTVTVVRGSTGSTTISTTVTSGSAQNVGLSVSGLPSGATPSFSPGTVAAGGSSTLSIDTDGGTPLGTFPLTVTGTGTTATHSTPVTLVVVASGGGGTATTSSSSSTSTSTYGGSTTYDPLLTPYSVTVVCHVPTRTYFLGILGWRQTNPTATATASILNIDDVSKAEFANAPFAVPSIGRSQDDGITRSLLVGDPIGHTFYIYGSSMGTNYPTLTDAPVSWQGQVSSSGSHNVGSRLTPVNGNLSGPSTFVAGGGYYVLPIVDPVTWLVEAYGIFQVVTGSSHVGRLVDSVPAQSGPMPQTLTVATRPYSYAQYYQGVTIKLSE